jgi:hypothetical protein
MSELTPQHVLVDLFEELLVPNPAEMAAIVIQRLIDGLGGHDLDIPRAICARAGRERDVWDQALTRAGRAGLLGFVTR